MGLFNYVRSFNPFNNRPKWECQSCGTVHRTNPPECKQCGSKILGQYYN